MAWGELENYQTREQAEQGLARAQAVAPAGTVLTVVSDGPEWGLTYTSPVEVSDADLDCMRRAARPSST
jgi:hypothetical protein